MLEPWAVSHKGLKKKLAWAAYQRRDLRHAAILHATTPAEADNLRALNLGVEVGVVPNGVDVGPSAFRTRPRENRGDPQWRTALFIGRVYPVKGLPMLIEAWASARPPGWKLRIVGPDEAGHLAVIKNSVRLAGLDSVVSFRGAVDSLEKTSELESADLFVLPSHSESFGMVVAEALAAGLPVLTTTRVPWPQLSSINCGWRAEPDPVAFARALIEATSTGSATLAAMGERGRELMNTEFRWESVARGMNELYERVSRSSRRNSAGQMGAGTS
jgi:glycosyltransferase involved in cell wall biosynthesis